MKLLKRILIILLLIILLFTLYMIFSGYMKCKKAIRNKPVKIAVEEIMKKENYTSIEDISPTFVNAMVAVEDRRFFKHGGVDVMGVIRATTVNLISRETLQGGSSITQQLAKNIYFINDNSVSRKIAECMIALDIEKMYSKEEILELYFNTIYYGSGYYNIHDASMGYFGKSPSQLNDYEATLLAGIPNAPSVYSLDNNPDLAKERQKTVLKAMVNAGMITDSESEQILLQE